MQKSTYTSTKREAQAAATRTHLLEAARRVFAEAGYAGATVASITREAGTAHGTFYLYFRNKDEAFMEVVEAVMLELHDEVLAIDVVDGADLRAIVEVALRRFFAGFAANEGIWRSLLQGALNSPELAERWSTISGGFHHRVARLVDDLQDAGLIRAVDSAAMGSALASIGEWMAMSRLLSAGMTPEMDERRFATLVDVWYHTLAPAALDAG